MIYLTDTHALIWFLTADSRLSPAARDVFEEAEKGKTIILITTISLLEILYVCEKKGKKEEFTALLRDLLGSLNYIVLDVTLDAVLLCADLPLVEEMHDRIIVAISKQVHAVLITKDKNIITSGYVNVVW